MSELVYALDSNSLIDILRQRHPVVERLGLALSNNARLLLCPVVHYEVYRGLLYRDALKQLTAFLAFTAKLISDPIEQEDWNLAAEKWADLRRQGRAMSDADILIGIYANRRNAIVITDNEKHFRLLDATIENWRV